MNPRIQTINGDVHFNAEMLAAICPQNESILQAEFSKSCMYLVGGLRLSVLPSVEEARQSLHDYLPDLFSISTVDGMAAVVARAVEAICPAADSCQIWTKSRMFLAGGANLPLRLSVDEARITLCHDSPPLVQVSTVDGLAFVAPRAIVAILPPSTPFSLWHRSDIQLACCKMLSLSISVEEASQLLFVPATALAASSTGV